MNLPFNTMRSRKKDGSAGATVSARSAGALAAAAFSALLIAGVGIANAQVVEPVISSVVATPSASGATITWTTDENANSQIAYGLTVPYTASTTLDTNQVMDHSEMISGLSPSTLYHFEVISTDATGSTQVSPDQTFTTLASSTLTGTSTDLTTIQNEITTIESEIAALQQQVTAIMQTLGQSTTTTPTTAPMIDQNGQTFSAGGTIDFGGHDFDHEEQVTVSLNGVTVATAHADGGGNFSTGSLTLPTTAGTYTYSFMGADGDSATATVTVQ